MRSFAPDRSGFTIVEILLALLLLSFTVLGFQAATGEIIHQAAESDRQAMAVQVVEDRLDLVRLDPDYGALATRYGEAGTTLDRFPGLERTTRVVRTRVRQSTGLLDYVTVTISVDGTGLRAPVSRTIVLAAP
jgi:Tfp pilus assembly protein PilV